MPEHSALIKRLDSVGVSELCYKNYACIVESTYPEISIFLHLVEGSIERLKRDSVANNTNQ